MYSHPRLGRGLSVLSDRELKVLVLIGRGLSNAEQHGRCSSARRSSRTYVSWLLTKFDIINRTQAGILGHEAGLLDDQAQ
jgi:DNA-binding CsgD family transcriptional regulator